MPTEILSSSDLLLNFLISTVTNWGLKLLAATVVWFIGRKLIKVVTQLFTRLLQSGKQIDRTLVSYLSSVISWLLTLFLLLSILGIFGIQTTSFAAILAGVGLAIGTAWGGLLAHFAAGIFLQMMRPFNVGDVITGAGITGTVSNIGVFSTTIITVGNIQTSVPNNKLLSDNIQNFSLQSYRRAESSFIIPLDADANKAIDILMPALLKIDNVRVDPAPLTTVSEFLPTGIKLTVCVYATNANYIQVLDDVNRGIAKLLPTLRASI